MVCFRKERRSWRSGKTREIRFIAWLEAEDLSGLDS